MTAPTGVLLLNMGGPWTLDEVGPFLRRLFSDTEVIRLPAGRVLAPVLVRARLPRVRRLYASIGGGSPQRDWTERQAEAMVKELDATCPATAPHRAYQAFRYASPGSAEAIAAMRADGVRRVVVFPLYPHYSCATTGSSLSDLWRAAGVRADEFEWSLIDRWPTHPAYVDALAQTLREGLDGFGDTTPVLFSAHSLPSRTVSRGDPYPQEVAATVQAVMERLAVPNPYLLSFQSKVGPVTWQGPDTVAMVEGLAARGHRRVLVVPVSFTCDHIETLSELDIELAATARRAGIEMRRAPALNDRPEFTQAMAQIVADHVAGGQPCSGQYRLRCPGCDQQGCRTLPGVAS
jgi:ferrochelatase